MPIGRGFGCCDPARPYAAYGLYCNRHAGPLNRNQRAIKSEVRAIMQLRERLGKKALGLGLILDYMVRDL